MIVYHHNRRGIICVRKFRFRTYDETLNELMEMRSRVHGESRILINAREMIARQSLVNLRANLLIKLLRSSYKNKKYKILTRISRLVSGMVTVRVPENAINLFLESVEDKQQINLYGKLPPSSNHHVFVSYGDCQGISVHWEGGRFGTIGFGIFTPLKNYYRQNYSQWCEKHQKLLKEDFAGMMRDPFYESFKPRNLISAFQAMEIYPPKESKPAASTKIQANLLGHNTIQEHITAL